MEAPGPVRPNSGVMNTLTGLAVWILRDFGPLIVFYATNRRAVAKGTPVPIAPDTVYYFRLCSWVWTVYFFLKAGFYAWIGHEYDLERALATRLVVGNVTFYSLLFVSIFLAKPIIRWLQAGLAPSTRLQPDPVGDEAMRAKP